MRKGDIIAYLDQFEDGDEVTLTDLQIMASELESREQRTTWAEPDDDEVAAWSGDDK